MRVLASTDVLASVGTCPGGVGALVVQLVESRAYNPKDTGYST